jgi:hypothetical protein
VFQRLVDRYSLTIEEKAIEDPRIALLLSASISQPSFSRMVASEKFLRDKAHEAELFRARLLRMIE